MQPFEEYKNKVKPGGLIVLSRSPTHVDTGDITLPKDVAILEIPATELAQQLGNQMVVSMISLGAFAEATRVVSIQSLLSGLEEILPPHRHQYLRVNNSAIQRGADFVKELKGRSDWKTSALFKVFD
jgi:2-oxoglutarate ferredoxin oxidoreductase subunit gamma